MAAWPTHFRAEDEVQARQIFETVLYASDLPACERFYCDVFGLPLIERFEGALAFRCGAGVLLIFNPQVSRQTNRGVPAHGTNGAGHIAFALPAGELDAWRAHLSALQVPIEMEVDWPAGGRSLYVRDPAGNSVELAPATLWGGGWGF